MGSDQALSSFPVQGVCPADESSAPGWQNATQGPGSEKDVNHFGLRDMAGNGREWTSGNLTTVDGEPMAILRGRNFTLKEALGSHHLQEQKDDLTQRQLPNVPSPYTSFRVVLPAE